VKVAGEETNGTLAAFVLWSKQPHGPFGQVRISNTLSLSRDGAR